MRWGFATVAVVIGVSAAMWIAVQSDADSSTQVVAVVGIAGTLGVSLISVLAARDTALLNLRGERDRLAAQLSHELTSARRQRIVDLRDPGVQAARAHVTRMNAIADAIEAMVQVVANPEDEAYRNILRDMNKRLADSRVERVTGGEIRANLARREVRDALAAFSDASTAVTKVGDELVALARTPLEQQVGEIVALVDAYNERRRKYDDASLALAESLEAYGSGVDVRDEDQADASGEG